MKEVINYNTTGTCCRQMKITIEDGVVLDAEFIGGCSGNLLGIKQLMIGMKLEDLVQKFRGITCGTKQTSCPDQLAKCLAAYIEEKTKTSQVL